MDENGATGTSFRAAVTATNPDPGTRIVRHGCESVRHQRRYDQENQHWRSLTVNACDGNGDAASAAVRENLTDMDESTPVTG